MSNPNPDSLELTARAVALGILLALLLSAANAYLGLMAGMTISASIPAAVLSMLILRAARPSSRLESNLVQTAASAGEAVAAGAVFTLPALIVLGTWEELTYWRATAWVGVGGLLGVVFSVPLRRILVVREGLSFPEGVATAEVLRAGVEPDDGRKPVQNPSRGSIVGLVVSALAAGVMKLAEAGFGLWSGTLTGATRVGRTLLAGGVSLSPALMAVGYIVGLRIASLILFGGVIAWGIALPILGWYGGVPGGEPYPVALGLWSDRIRFLGVGAMITGGLGSLVELASPMRDALAGGLRRWRYTGSPAATADRDRDLDARWLVAGLAVSSGGLLMLLMGLLPSLPLSLLSLVILLGAGFLFSAVAGYMAGLVGSSNNPVSGVTIATLLFLSLVLLVFLGRHHAGGATAALLCAATVACAAAISGDTMQDLKAGHLLGAVPWKQQVMEFVGVGTASLVIVPVIVLLDQRYGIGVATAAHPDPLPAPQATLMASVTRGVFSGDLPWGMVFAGMGIGAAVVLLDRFLRRRDTGWRIPVLAVAVGIYLPLPLSVTIFLGGLLNRLSRGKLEPDPARDPGILVGCGIITGEAVTGVLLALPVALAPLVPGLGVDVLALFETPPPFGFVLGTLGLLALGGYLARSGRRTAKSD